MKNFHNIEKLEGRKDYTGYAAGTVWKIGKSSSSDGNWVAFPRDHKHDSHYPWRIAAMTLAAMSDKLAQL